ncbi:MAG TPA: prepilin-type N-terminal cleavage/methylation domain-containing protein [Candidatus Saccharimonadales bacterium]|nr:prepilin-type N-terminal cleavage/methylation domain-containing protein [Candidatus Saccharimonadales bacterium]
MIRLQNHDRNFLILNPRSGSGTTRNGFTFIEIIVALALLSIMGTSLFLMQSTIFQKLTKSHNIVSNLLEIDKEMIDFKLALAQALQDKKSMAEVTIHQVKHNPDMKIDVVVKPIQESSKLYKQFSKNVFMIQATITKDQQQNQWVSFLYVPPKPEEKEEKAPSAKTPIAKTPTAKGVA